MNAFQSTLGEDPDIAEELAESQRSISIAEFFEKNKHMLGFDSGARGLVTAVKEAVDNALDATEEADIAPDIHVEIAEAGNYYKLVVEDNGPGITADQVPRVFGKLLYGSRFHKREQKRGQQGIGISAAVLYSQLTSGTPAKITSRTSGSERAKYFELIIDTDSNEPEIQAERETTWDRPHGTRIELEMDANMRARGQLRDYIKHTAVVNPHARIELREPGGEFKAERGTDQLPAETEEIRPHPHGVELGSLIKMLGASDSYSLSGFLQEEFTRVGATTANNVLGAFRDREFGRELAWSPPEREECIEAIADVVANKPAEATETFAVEVADRVLERDRLSHHEVREEVAAAAEAATEGTGTTFGDTVQEKATAAVWKEVIESREADCYALVDSATISRKDEAVVRALSRRGGAKFGGHRGGGTARSGAGEADPAQRRDRATHGTIRSYVDRAADMTVTEDEATVGETAREKITEALWAIGREVPDDPPKVRAVAADRDTAGRLLRAMGETDIIAPPTECLSPITDELLRTGLEKEFDADFYASATRDAAVHGGDPFIVEAGIAYGGELESEGSVDLLRFANRVPLVYQRGACATTDVIKGIGWRNYGLDQPGGNGLPSGPAVLMIHVASTNVPFTSESKDAIANVPEIEHEIELAIREAARELKAYLKKQRSMAKRREKEDVLATILPRMAEKLTDVTEREPLRIEDSLARIMNNVLVERAVENREVSVVVENHSATDESPELTEIVSAEPSAVSDGANVIEMDGEWFIEWSPTVESGSEATLEYTLNGNDEDPSASFDLDVDGIESEKVTVNTASDAAAVSTTTTPTPSS
jgi:DNA topoisomerase-6 subunit B